MRRSAALLLLAVVLAAGSPARASVAIALSVEELAQKADVVVRGRVTSQESAWTRGGRIVTTVHLAVDGALKGTPGASLDVRHTGGRVGDIGQQVSGEVSFQPGEEVVVFLRAHPHLPGAFTVVGLSQGKFRVDRTGAKPVVLQQLDGLGLLDRARGTVEDRPGEKLPLEQLVARVAKAGR